MKCKNCGQEIDKKAVVCTACGCKVKKPFYKKWWVWTIVVIIVISIGASTGNDGQKTASKNEIPTTEEEVISYEQVSLQTMFDDLSANALKAENTYKNKTIEFKCKISSFDSSGAYIGVEPENAPEFNLSTALCYIKDDTQKEFLIQKNVGDVINIKGKVKSVGEVLGYSINIDEVN